MVSKSLTAKNRLEILDDLRGFFIIVIIIDHLSRWPSIFAAVTGKAMLWVTAAEGFVAISGLLVGYVRGYKNRELPLKTVSKKLLRRAFLLYAWSILATIVYTAIIWYVPLRGGAPTPPLASDDWLGLIWQSLTLQYTNVWVHFLTLYALFLAAAPLAIWLLRAGHATTLAIISFALLVVGWQVNSEALQWQFLFFMPVIAGYHLDDMRKWWRHLSAKKRTQSMVAVLSLTAATMTISVIATFNPEQVPALASLNSLFPKETITIWRAAVAFLWFTGLVFFFGLIFRPFLKSIGWLLKTFGTRSLTAYLLHGLALCLISFATFSGDDIIANSLMGATAIMLTWAMIKIPHINRVIPR